MLIQYAGEIRVTIELLLMLSSMWWTIRTFALASSQKDALRREEDDAHEQLGGLQSSLKKLTEAAHKVRDLVLPSQETVLVQLQTQVTTAEQEIERSQLPVKVKFYQEVREFYESQPDSRYFRASDWAPPDDV